MAEWFAGQIMDKIINTCFEYLQDHLGSQSRMEKDLQRLRDNHPKIQAVLSASRQAQIRDPALKRWICQLRDAIDEADDLLDEFEYLEHKERLVRQNMEGKKVRFAIPSLLSEGAHKVRRVCGHAFNSDSNLKNRLEESVQKLDKVSDEVGTFLHLLDNTKHEHQAMEQQLWDDRASGSSPGLVFIGRGEEKEYVMQWLRKPSNEHPTHITGATSRNRISLLSIIGHGGMGKTTLIQEVFNDLEEEFDLKIWVCVSNNFKEEKVIADMLKYLDKWSSHLTELSALQEKLKSTMQSKKFLLVMDDIWEENTTKWEKVLSPMANGKLGSKILITTRMNSVASMIANAVLDKQMLRLEGLEEDQCLKLLKTHAFVGVENLRDHKKLACIAEKIVKKLSGSPLAAKVIGGVLRYDLTPEHWERVLKNNIGSIELVPGQNTNTIMPILRLSFAFLPEPLQNCFAFCSIFPKDHLFDKDDLVRMWIALSFIQSSSIAEESLEDIGGRYFDILVRKSFFDEFQNNKETYYKMHDLLHELAQSVSTEECFSFVGNEGLTLKIPKSIRHLFVKTTNHEVLRNIREVKNLHSLFLTSYGGDQNLFGVLNEVLKESRNLRLMVISLPNMKMIPVAIESLVHLRYIKFFFICESSLSLMSDLCNLYHLQFIIYDDGDGCYSIYDEIVITNMSNLSNLRYLNLPKCFEDENCFRMPGIGKLSSLQVLDPFYVRDENGYKIGELEHMNELRQLTIIFPTLIKDDKEACTAKLRDKKKLTNLSLKYPDSSVILDDLKRKELEEKVLDNLQPYNNLKSLSISSYLGARSARWMYNADLICNLEYIKLSGCSNWENLPPFGQLPFLKYLYLSFMSSAKRLECKFHGTDKGSVFPSLEVLHMMYLDKLEDWFDAAGAAEDNCLFPCLTELFLIECPNLQELPYLPPKLKKVKIENIGWNALNWKQGTSNCCSISKPIPLETLKIIGCPNLTSLPLSDVRLEALRKLTIRGQPNLISLSGLQEVKSIENFQFILGELTIDNPSVLLMEPLRSITSVKKLTIENNDEVVSFPIELEQWFLQVSSSLCELSFLSLKSLLSLPSSLPASLESLHLKKLESLQCLPSSFSAISSLKLLCLRCIPLLKSLPDLPPSLSELHLSHLDQLECLPSCLVSFSSLMHICIIKAPQLRELPDLPPSLEWLTIIICHPELRERYEKLSGSDRHKVAHIPYVWFVQS